MHESVNISLKLTNNCNLSCKYCYEKSRGNKSILNLNSLEHFFKDCKNHTVDRVQFVWHGGEPLLVGLDYLKNLRELQKRHLEDNQIIVKNCIQTNGMLLNKEHIQFFLKENIGVGISIDGPRRFHDHYRRTLSDEESFKVLIPKIDLIKEYNIPLSISCVITSMSVKQPEEYWLFFSQIAADFVDFLPCQYFDSNKNTQPLAVSGVDFSYFLTSIFDKWMSSDNTKIRFKIFENLIYRMTSIGNDSFCQTSGRCMDYYTITTDGKLYACDWFVGKNDFLYGELKQFTLDDLLSRNLPNKVVSSIIELYTFCKACKWFNVCNGGCPYQHYLSNIKNHKGFDCESRNILFSHIESYLNRFEELC